MRVFELFKLTLVNARSPDPPRVEREAKFLYRFLGEGECEPRSAVKKNHRHKGLRCAFVELVNTYFIVDTLANLSDCGDRIIVFIVCRVARRRSSDAAASNRRAQNGDLAVATDIFFAGRQTIREVEDKRSARAN